MEIEKAIQDFKQKIEVAIQDFFLQIQYISLQCNFFKNFLLGVGQGQTPIPFLGMKICTIYI